uniref:Uncharacterized protein n=1 Tax=Cucumis melo TaxID=3656 RepID=A0A9I9EAQ9_CUCME
MKSSPSSLLALPWLTCGSPKSSIFTVLDSTISSLVLTLSGVLAPIVIFVTSSPLYNSVSVATASFSNICRSEIPQSLINFLEDDTFTFVGVGIDNGVLKHYSDYDLNVDNTVDLRELAADEICG